MKAVFRVIKETILIFFLCISIGMVLIFISPFLFKAMDIVWKFSNSLLKGL